MRRPFPRQAGGKDHRKSTPSPAQVHETAFSSTGRGKRPAQTHTKTMRWPFPRQAGGKGHRKRTPRPSKNISNCCSAEIFDNFWPACRQKGSHCFRRVFWSLHMWVLLHLPVEEKASNHECKVLPPSEIIVILSSFGGVLSNISSFT